MNLLVWLMYSAYSFLMRSLSIFSLTFVLLFSASSAEAYFRILPSETVAPVRAPAMAVINWPEWLGMPQWMNALSPVASVPPVIVRTGTQSTESWPLWIDQPHWLE